MAAVRLYLCTIWQILYTFSVSTCKAHGAKLDVRYIRTNYSIFIIKSLVQPYFVHASSVTANSWPSYGNWGMADSTGSGLSVRFLSLERCLPIRTRISNAGTSLGSGMLYCTSTCKSLKNICKKIYVWCIYWQIVITSRRSLLRRQEMKMKWLVF